MTILTSRIFVDVPAFRRDLLAPSYTRTMGGSAFLHDVRTFEPDFVIIGFAM